MWEKMSLSLFKDDSKPYDGVMPLIKSVGEKGEAKINIWDIPFSISSLSYTSHSHYRYYGKFPSVVAGQVLEQFPPSKSSDYVLDNFSGSGTTLVEAKLRGINSLGLDISWLSVLASKVKTQFLDTNEVSEQLASLVSWFELSKTKFSTPEDPLVEKWFAHEASRDLAAIQFYLHKMTPSPCRDFLLVAFLAIIRRVSRAYDAEVRPHVNKTKKQRCVISAFAKKVNDMVKDHVSYMQYADKEAYAEAKVANNLDLKIDQSQGSCYLVLSHPPYLNSFNYTPVYKLEFYWAKPFESQFTDGIEDLHKAELKAHPANEKVTEEYFGHLRKCYQETFQLQPEGGVLAIVIGDCTRKGKVIPVIDKVIEICSDIGYKLTEINYRTTHYGLGKYAYSDRANYHGEDEDKKDGILIFKK